MKRVCVASPTNRGGDFGMARVCAIICYLYFLLIVISCAVYNFSCFVRTKVPNFVKVKYLNQARAHDLPPAHGPGRGEEPEGGDRQEPFTPRPCISAPSPSFTKMVENAVDLLLLKLLHLIFINKL